MGFRMLSLKLFVSVLTPGEQFETESSQKRRDYVCLAS